MFGVMICVVAQLSAFILMADNDDDNRSEEKR
jgi:hypothetical protein